MLTVNNALALAEEKAVLEKRLKEQIEQIKILSAELIQFEKENSRLQALIENIEKELKDITERYKVFSITSQQFEVIPIYSSSSDTYLGLHAKKSSNCIAFSYV